MRRMKCISCRRIRHFQIIKYILLATLIFIGTFYTTLYEKTKSSLFVSALLSTHYTPKEDLDELHRLNTDVQIVEKSPPTNTNKNKYHIGFLKVHKAGSTTMQNLLFRFGLKYNLTFALPRQGNYLLASSQVMPLDKNRHHDIFACHTVYSKQLFDRLMPADRFNIGIIRDPLERMISAAYYYRDVHGVAYLKHVPNDAFIQNLINYPEKFDNNFFSYTRNSMGKDFGFFAGTNPSDVLRINKTLEEIDKEFTLVLVIERFEESLILMKRLLGWDMSDVLFLQTNSYKHSTVQISETDKSKLRKSIFLDYAIFDFFSEVFNKKIKAEGNAFKSEVAYFKTVLDRVQSFCDTKNGTTEGSLNLEISESKWNEAFSVTNVDCKFMTMDEMNFIKQLGERRRQQHL